MKLSLFDYYLPKKLIAQKPKHPRDHSRLLVLDRKTGKIQHQHFYNIIDFLQKGDVLVLNDTKVFPARLWGRKKETGGKIEVLLLSKQPHRAGFLTRDPDLRRGSKTRDNIWQCLLGGKVRRVNLELEFKKDLKAKILKQQSDRTWLLKFNFTGQKFKNILQKIGEAPTPPYIKQKSDLKNYQTIYAKHLGSVAAPTAGFHFTKPLIKKLKKKGVQFEYITLHVGLGTFEPVRVEDITKHKMHTEFASIDKKTAQRINQAKRENRHIIAVGTTSARVLESCVKKSPTCLAEDGESRRASYKLIPTSSYINSFIYPGYKFKIVDAMITNFHLPKSTLLMLVSAFAGRNRILKTYQIAIRKKYRFYSFGDAMLIR